jgi:hypothetical protein
MSFPRRPGRLSAHATPHEGGKKVPSRIIQYREEEIMVCKLIVSSKRVHGARFPAAAAFAVLFCLRLGAQDLKTDFENYFVEIKDVFNNIATSSSIKKTRLSSIDRYFVGILKRNQVFYSLIKTNSKGIIISEVIRGETPARDYRNIASQQWYRYIVRTGNDYHGFLEEKGRYYLFWAKPIILTARSGKKNFSGAVAVKIDLWDCFHKLSVNKEQPFLVRLNRKSLYSHKWQPEFQAQEENLDIAGIDRISVLSEPRAAVPESIDSVALGLKAPDVAAEAGTDEAQFPVSFDIKSYMPIIVAAVVLFVILVLAVIRLLIWVRYKRLENKIDKESLL